MEKKINYLARTFDDIKAELIRFSKTNYPEVADSFDDGSVGSWMIDLVAAVGDDLSYHTDRMAQEMNINTANLSSTLKNIARASGIKVPGRKASMCEVKLSCVLPMDPTNLAIPDWRYAPIVRKGSSVAAGAHIFEFERDVNFATQFNDEGYSDRSFAPRRSSNGGVTGYTVTKSAIVIGATSRVYKKIMTEADVKPFMEVVLPETNVMNIESIIFKETAGAANDPSISEYYVEEEQYKLARQDAFTYRFFEVDCLADQYRWGTATQGKIDDGIVLDEYEPGVYEYYPSIVEDVDENGEEDTLQLDNYYKIYRGEWKPITQKFITEYTDNGYMKIIFGPGVAYDKVPEGVDNYAEYRMSKLINNDMMGVLPRIGWTMFVLYNVGGGTDTNVGPGAINSINKLVSEFPLDDGSLQGAQKGSVVNSFSVTNPTTAVAGKDEPSANELKYLIKYGTGSQERCVTVKDYAYRLMQMPPRFGAPFRSSVLEENNKILMYLLGLNAAGKLDKFLPQALVDNIINYLSHYRTVSDYVEIKSGKVYNIGFSIDVFIDKTYNTASVIKNIIETVKEYMSVKNHEMGEDIFIGDLEKEIMLIDGVLSLISLKVYALMGAKYSTDKCPLPLGSVADGDPCNQMVEDPFVTPDGAQSYQINLNKTDKMLYGNVDAMYEVLTDTDIQVRAKLK